MKNKLYRNGRNGSSVGFFLTLFDNNLDCQIDEIGSRAQVFWIWQTKKCTPIYLNGQFTHEYYKLNGSNFQLMCEDSECTNCRLVCLFLVARLGTLQGTLLGTLLGHFWGHFLGQFTHEHYNLNGSNFQLKCEDSECTNFRLGFSELKL